MDLVPLMARLNLFGIRQMRARTLLGRLVSRIMGFDLLGDSELEGRVQSLLKMRWMSAWPRAFGGT